ncbi:MAG: NAD(P)-dependent oxidoreductase [Methanogenium sp.]|jgi:nucleoside-diphosphate-sugar epimerase
MNIVITGSEGFVGHYVAQHFCKLGHKVFGIDNLCRYGKRRETLSQYPNYIFIEHDLTQSFSWYFATIKPHIIIDMASIVGGVSKFNTNNKFDDMINNIYIHNHMLNWAKVLYNDNILKRFITISSSIVYHNSNHEEENKDVVIPTHPYGYYKYTCEYLTKQANIPYTICRLYNCIGVGEDDEKHAHVFADFARQLNRSKQIVIGNNTIRNFVKCEDIGVVLEKILSKNITINQTYNVCSSKYLSMKDVAKNLVNVQRFLDEYKSIKYDNKDIYELDISIMQGNYNKLYDAIKYIPNSDDINWKELLEYYK